MTQWRKRFEAWRTAKAPVPKGEAEALPCRVFGERVRFHPGGSHQWTLAVPELAEQHPDYRFGLIVVPVSGGQWVKAPYCQMAYDAALRLGLLEDEGDEEA